MQGASSGVVRYRAKDNVTKVLESADGEGKLQIAGFTATVKKLEGVLHTMPCRYLFQDRHLTTSAAASLFVRKGQCCCSGSYTRGVLAAQS